MGIRRTSCSEWESSSSQGVLSQSEIVLLLLLPQSFSSGLVLGESLSESSGLFVSQVKRSALLLVVNAGLISSLLVDHSEHLGNSLSNYLQPFEMEENLLWFLQAWLEEQLKPCLLWVERVLSKDDISRTKLTLNLVSSETRPVSSFYLSSCALTLCIFINLIY